MKGSPASHLFPFFERAVKMLRRGLLRLAHMMLFGHYALPWNGKAVPRRILVLRISAVGDFILAVPAFNLLRRAFPEAEVLLVTAPSSNPKVSGASARYNVTSEPCPWVRFVFPSRVNRMLVCDSFSYRYLRREVAPVIRSFQPDAAFVLPQQDGGTVRSQLSKLLFLKIIGVKSHVFGWRSGSGPLFRGWHFKTGKVEHAVRAPLNAVREHPVVARLPAMQISFNLDIPLPDTRWAEVIAGGLGWKTNLVIAISISAVHEHKQWGGDKFIELANRLLSTTSAKLVVLGTKGMEAVGNQIGKLDVSRVTTLCGMTTITQMAALLKHCQVLVGNDGGAMHIGAAVGCQCVALMPGLEYPGSIEPWGNGATAVRHSVECSPCYSFTACPRKHMRCMRMIGVEEVLVVCNTLLRNAVFLNDKPEAKFNNRLTNKT